MTLIPSSQKYLPNLQNSRYSWIQYRNQWRVHFVGSLTQSPEKAMAPHSSALAWKIPWAEEPGRLQSLGSLRVSTTERLHFHFSLSCTGEGNGNPLQCSCLETPRDIGAWWAAVYGVAQSGTRLKRLSSSSSDPRPEQSLPTQSKGHWWLATLYKVMFQLSRHCVPERVAQMTSFSIYSIMRSKHSHSLHFEI